MVFFALWQKGGGVPHAFTFNKRPRGFYQLSGLMPAKILLGNVGNGVKLYLHLVFKRPSVRASTERLLYVTKALTIKGVR